MTKFKKANVNVRLMSQDEFDRKVKRSPEVIKGFLRLAVQGYEENGDQELFLSALMNAVKWAGVAAVARKAKLTRQGIYTALNRKNANPNLHTFTAILGALGVKMTFEVGKMPTLPARTYNRSGSYAQM